MFRNKLTLRIQPQPGQGAEPVIDNRARKLHYNLKKKEWYTKDGKPSKPVNTQIYYPVYYIVNLNGIRIKRGSLNLFVNPEKWDYYRQCMKGTSQEAVYANDRISNFRKRCEEVFNRLNEMGIVINGTKFLELITAEDKGERDYSMFELFDEFLEKQRELGLAKGTLKGYASVRSSLAKLLQAEYYADDMPISQTDPQILIKLANMMDAGKAAKKNTVGKARKFFSWVEKKAALSRLTPGAYEFDFNKKILDVDWKDVVCKKAEKKLKVYTYEEVETIRKSCFEQEDKFLAAHLFQIETGMAFKDILFFQPELHIIRHMDGRQVIKKIRNKNLNREEDIWFEVPLTETAAYILQHWADQGQYSFKYLREYHHYHHYLKAMSSKIGVKMSTHKARHTFGTMQADKGVSMEVIQKMMGHSNIATTMHYAKISTSRIMREFGEESKKAV